MEEYKPVHKTTTKSPRSEIEGLSSQKRHLKKLDLTCEVCDNEIDPDGVNMNSTLAKCNHCGSLLFLDDDDFFGRRKRNRPEMMIPEGTEVLHLPSSLDIRTQWNRSRSKGPGTWFIAFFAVMWNVMLLPFVLSSIASGALLSLLPLIGHLAVGFGLIYYLLTIFLNHTDVYVTDNEITITSKPLKNPFRPDTIIPTSDINQLYVSRYVSSITNGVPQHAYALYAITSNDRRISLLRGMNKETQLYIEQEIENFLDIDDVQVMDEVN